MEGTIFARATAGGKAGVAVIRISGPAAKTVASELVGKLPLERHAGLRELKDSNGNVLDRALVIWFGEGHSFTGEDVVELQLHGSVAVVNAVQRRLSEFPNCRPAEAGEFTRRALENDRLDLSQIEGLADLIDAETEWQRRQAMQVFSGSLGKKVELWRTRLIRAAALLEATLDFADEDVPVDVNPEVNSLLAEVLRDLEEEQYGSEAAESIRDGFEVAILGAPNVGKSTLLNALAGRDAAITSDVAGTTRDVIEVRMDVRGLPVTFLDTAGLRDARDQVEQIGIDRAVSRASSADLRVFLGAPGTTYSGVLKKDGDIQVVCKGDLLDDPVESVSGKTGAGISALVDRIADELEGRAMFARSATHERHRLAIERAIFAIHVAFEKMDDENFLAEIVAEEVRSAIFALESLIGRIDVEILLDEIFSSFCIGK